PFRYTFLPGFSLFASDGLSYIWRVSPTTTFRDKLFTATVPGAAIGRNGRTNLSLSEMILHSEIMCYERDLPQPGVEIDNESLLREAQKALSLGYATTFRIQYQEQPAQGSLSVILRGVV